MMAIRMSWLIRARCPDLADPAARLRMGKDHWTWVCGVAMVARIQIDPVLCGTAARLTLDTISVLDLEVDGTDAADNRALLALDPLGLDLENSSEEFKAYSAASAELLWVVMGLLSQWRKEDRRVTIALIRELLPRLYPEAYGGPPPA